MSIWNQSTKTKMQQTKTLPNTIASAMARGWRVSCNVEMGFFRYGSLKNEASG